MPSLSPDRGRSRSGSNPPDADKSPTPSRELSPPRRSISPRSNSRSRSRSITRDAPRQDTRRNGARNGRSRTRSYSRSLSRGRSYSRSMSRGSPAPRSSKIVVEKLTKNVNENHLREIFGAYGSIKELDLPMNKSFMTNRGTAYILYTSTTDAEAAIAHMHEAQLDGAIIHVSIVLPRRKFSRSPPPVRRGGPPPFDRFDNRGPPPGAYRGGPPPTSGYGGPPPPSSRYRSPPPPRRGSPPRGYGRRPEYRHPRDRNGDVYRPRSYSRSRSRSYSSRSRSPTPPRRGGGRGYRTKDSPPGGGRRRRSPSYSSYSSYSDRSRSRDRTRGRYGRDR